MGLPNLISSSHLYIDHATSEYDDPLDDYPNLHPNPRSRNHNLLLHLFTPRQPSLAPRRTGRISFQLLGRDGRRGCLLRRGVWRVSLCGVSRFLGFAPVKRERWREKRIVWRRAGLYLSLRLKTKLTDYILFCSSILRYWLSSIIHNHFLPRRTSSL